MKIYLSTALLVYLCEEFQKTEKIIVNSFSNHSAKHRNCQLVDIYNRTIKLFTKLSKYKNLKKNRQSHNFEHLRENYVSNIAQRNVAEKECGELLHYII